MSSEGLHEASDQLTPETRDLHRAVVSLREELEAVDWYRQRADACTDAQLKAILLHNMREEMEHAAMLIEWLRRNNRDFEGHLRTYAFTDRPIVDIEATDTSEKDDGSVEDSAGGHTIGDLKE